MTQLTYKKIQTKEDLFELVKVAREDGQQIVMTNGCFDLLHPGHVDYLEKARALGDRLIVAVNDDDSIKRLKGDQRPINDIEFRTRMLSALDCVNWVVSFSEDTPENLYSKIPPDILVKGGDYAEDEVIGADSVKKAGGRVEIIPFLEGYSSTELIIKIKQS